MEFFQYLLVPVTDSLTEGVQMQDLTEKGNHSFNLDLFLSFISVFEKLGQFINCDPNLLEDFTIQLWGKKWLKDLMATTAQWNKEIQAAFKRWSEKELFMVLFWLSEPPEWLAKPEQTVVGVSKFWRDNTISLLKHYWLIFWKEAMLLPYLGFIFFTG